jgi:hypothetical protein
MGGASSLAEGAKLVPFPASGRSRDAGGGEEDPGSPPSIAPRSWVGEWPCNCGQRYRVLVEPLTFWPKNSAAGFRTEPAETCVSCGIELDDAFGLEAARIVLHLSA